MLKSFKKLNQTGDTIVEVMIVLAVLSLAIGISYATANRSLLNARQAQENTEASELVRTQVELLRSNIGDVVNGPKLKNNVHDNCISDVGKVIDFSLKPDQCTLLPLNYVKTITACKASLNARCKNGTNDLTLDDNFIVTVSWPDVIGDETDTVTTIYRVHAP